MNFKDVFQTGRNVRKLEDTSVELSAEKREKLLKERRHYEAAILQYDGRDPLELWFHWVRHVEQDYPMNEMKAALDDLLKECLSKFKKNYRYAQDPRLIRLYIKYIDSKENRNDYYSALYNSGLGTMVADLYIAWAHNFDLVEDFEQAEAIYQRGLDVKAAPIDRLERVYNRFKVSVAQRAIRRDEYRQEFLSDMEAQRKTFLSIYTAGWVKVRDIPTSSAVKKLKHLLRMLKQRARQIQFSIAMTLLQAQKMMSFRIKLLLMAHQKIGTYSRWLQQKKHYVQNWIGSWLKKMPKLFRRSNQEERLKPQLNRRIDVEESRVYDRSVLHIS